ncbi:ferric reductase [Didymella exigua CBS 183.55]|uniref:Ferric reductase n=1 Tax=Didymella exigua CBS 183.55 TaxID=1150837 RepID=A0A6A5RKJ8_9PLEO|nr:ferric reductase [Didymella exigua CBS 183.55]KAF1926906.1 ferric reductase [Didymella exigua CBS 183.55]
MSIHNELFTSSEPNIDDVHANASSSNLDPFKFSHGLTGVDQPANYLFINILIATLLLPIVLAFAYRSVIYLRNDRRRVSVINSCRGQNFWKRDRYSILGSLKRYFLYAPLMGDRHSRKLQVTPSVSARALPTRPQFLVIIIYITSNVAFCLAIPERPTAQRFAELRGRCGALAAFNLIITVLFALRNNPLIWLLGISYDTFNLFHRWAARLVVLESTAHVAAFVYSTYQVTYEGQNGWASIKWIIEQSVSYRWGLAGFIGFIFLLLQSLGPLRRAFYDTFLTLHRLGIIVSISGVYYHMAKHALPQLPWAYVVVILLALEPAIRMGRVVYYNFAWKQRAWTRVVLEALPGEATRVTFSIPQSWNVKPGSHTYVYLPRVAPLSLHPFSIAWHTSSGYTRLDSEKLQLSVADLMVEDGPSTISCIVRARRGMTRSLYDRASEAKTDHVELWGAIEGPYGGYHSLDSYGTVVLFAAGAGITHQLSFVRHLLAGYHHNTLATRKIVLVWCIPTIECVKWIYPWLEELAAMSDCADIVQIQLYVSRSTSQAAESLPLPIRAQIFSQRCDPQNIVDEQILVQVGAMVVTVCGPGGFNDSVRAAVRRRVGLRSIDFFEETFSS